jgi:hypothetical protein
MRKKVQAARRFALLGLSAEYIFPWYISSPFRISCCLMNTLPVS